LAAKIIIGYIILLDIVDLRVQIVVLPRNVKKILINPYFSPILLPFCIESNICRNISDSSSQSVLKLIVHK
jgi:hypothetical protein